MSELLRTLKKYKGTDDTAPVANGLKVGHGKADQCQCDCCECAGGDTSDDG